MWVTLSCVARCFMSRRFFAGLCPNATSTLNKFPVLPAVSCSYGLNKERCVIVRWIRTPRNSANSEPHSRENEHNRTGQTGESHDDQNSKDPKVDSALLRRLRRNFLVIGGLSFVITVVLLSLTPMGKTDMEDVSKYVARPGIDINLFFDNYLKAGEVRRIIFCPKHSRAVAYLYEGAVIDGKKVHEPVVVVAYSKSAQQFWDDVRKEENNLGISLSHGVRLDIYTGISIFRMVEFIVGILIIAFLGTMYGRLLRQKMLSSKNKE